MIFTTGCATYTNVPRKTANSLVIKSLPPFPPPHPTAVRELIEVCPYDKCVALYAWFEKLKVLQKQLDLYKEGINE